MQSEAKVPFPQITTNPSHFSLCHTPRIDFQAYQLHQPWTACLVDPLRSSRTSLNVQALYPHQCHIVRKHEEVPVKIPPPLIPVKWLPQRRVGRITVGKQKIYMPLLCLLLMFELINYTLLELKQFDQLLSLNQIMQQDRRDNRGGRKRSRSRSRQNHRQHNRNHSNRNRYDNNRNYNRNNQHRSNNIKIRPKVRPVNVQPPKSFVLSAPNECRGQLKVNIIKKESQPSRCQTSRLGQLKNQITPVQKLWSSHIKQYLNISEFVQIHRYNKSLAYAPIEYGKSVINYQEEFNSIHYSNLTEQSQIFSRAYFKLWEILQTGVLEQYKNKQMSIGCVAQGPGGFIHALIDYRIKQQRSELTLQKDHYNAITLKIDSNTRHAKDWSDQRASKLFGQLRRVGQSINLSYGKTGTGDLLNTQNIEYFSNEIKKKCELVTGDGGIECIGDKQFEYQQIFNVKLFFGEITTALHIQQVGGKFILKIYDCGFDLTRQLIVLLALYYDKVQIIKPITSRPGNSQKYLLCEDFRGITQEELSTLKDALTQWTQIEPKLSYFQNKQFVHSIFDFSEISNYQLIYNRIKQANDWFVEEQIQKIEEGLGLIEKYQDSATIERELKQSRFGQQISFAYSWCKKYGLPTIQVQVEQAEQ